MFGKLFPESIFARKLPEAAERRLRLAQARAEESIVRAHVDNALMFMDTLAEDMAFDRAIDTYVRVMGIPEPLASMVATRALVVLGQDLVPYRRRQRGPAAAAPRRRRRGAPAQARLTAGAGRARPRRAPRGHRGHGALVRRMGTPAGACVRAPGPPACRPRRPAAPRRRGAPSRRAP